MAAELQVRKTHLVDMQLYRSLHLCYRTLQTVKRQPGSFAPTGLTRMGWRSLLLLIHLAAYSLIRLIWLLWRFVRPARQAFFDCKLMSADCLLASPPVRPSHLRLCIVTVLAAVLPKDKGKQLTSDRDSCWPRIDGRVCGGATFSARSGAQRH